MLCYAHHARADMFRQSSASGSSDAVALSTSNALDPASLLDMACFDLPTSHPMRPQSKVRVVPSTYREKPPTSIFHWSLVISVSVQFVVHLAVLIYFVQICEPFIDREDESFGLEGEFKPNLKNTVCFLYQWWNSATVIFVNYYGRPFTQDIWESKKLRNGMIGLYAIAICIIFELIPEMNEGLELVPFPDEEF